jgi:hypothetical protein
MRKIGKQSLRGGACKASYRQLADRQTAPISAREFYALENALHLQILEPPAKLTEGQRQTRR